MKTELRDYQKKAVAAFMTSPSHRGLFKMHPGAGKSIAACGVIEALKQKPDLPILPGPFLTLITVPTIELRIQWSKVLSEQDLNYDTFILTYAMAAIKMRTDPKFFDIFTFIIWDEAHHLAEGPVFQRLLLHAFKAPFSLALTSTPPSDPQNPMNRVFPLLYEYGFEQSLPEGHVAPIETVVVKAKLNELERKKYDELTHAIRARIMWCGGFEQAMRSGSKHAMEMKVFMTQRKQLTAMADQKFVLLRDITEQLLGLCDCMPPDEPKPTRVLVWSEYVAALEKAKDELNRNGPIAELIHGDLPKKERARILELWGTDFPVLLAARIMEEGVDFPSVAHGIIIAGARTTRQNTQRVGRLLRPLPGKMAKLWVIVAEDTMEERLVDLINDVTAGVNND